MIPAFRQKCLQVGAHLTIRPVEPGLDTFDRSILATVPRGRTAEQAEEQHQVLPVAQQRLGTLAKPPDADEFLRKRPLWPQVDGMQDVLQAFAHRVERFRGRVMVKVVGRIQQVCPDHPPHNAAPGGRAQRSEFPCDRGPYFRHQVRRSFQVPVKTDLVPVRVSTKVAARLDDSDATGSLPCEQCDQHVPITDSPCAEEEHVQAFPGLPVPAPCCSACQAHQGADTLERHTQSMHLVLCGSLQGGHDRRVQGVQHRFHLGR